MLQLTCFLDIELVEVSLCNLHLFMLVDCETSNSACVNHAQIPTLKKPVLSNDRGLSFLLKKTSVAFDGVWTQTWNAPTDNKSDSTSL